MRAIVALLLAMALVGCGGAATASPSPSQTPQQTPVPAASASATTAARTTSLGELVAAEKAGQYRVSYHITSTAGGQTFTSDQTIYAKGAVSRYDMSFGGGTISTYSGPDGVVLCIQGQNACTRAGAAGAGAGAAAGPPNLSAQLDQSIRAQPDKYNSTAATQRTIAGVDAQCFTVADGTGGQGTVCYSAQGTPLYMQWTTPAGSFTMEATAISATVADEDLKPTAPVRNTP